MKATSNQQVRCPSQPSVIRDDSDAKMVPRCLLGSLDAGRAWRDRLRRAVQVVLDDEACAPFCSVTKIVQCSVPEYLLRRPLPIHPLVSDWPGARPRTVRRSRGERLSVNPRRSEFVWRRETGCSFRRTFVRNILKFMEAFAKLNERSISLKNRR